MPKRKTDSEPVALGLKYPDPRPIGERTKTAYFNIPIRRTAIDWHNLKFILTGLPTVLPEVAVPLEISIYALIDPKTASPFYVGQTSRYPEIRLFEHLVEAIVFQDIFDIWKPNIRRKLLIRELLLDGLAPRIKVLETLPPHTRQRTIWKRETHWQNVFDLEDDDDNYEDPYHKVVREVREAKVRPDSDRPTHNEESSSHGFGD